MKNSLHDERKQLYIRLLFRVILFVMVLLIFKYIVPLLLSLLSPFIVALIIAFFLNPLVSIIRRKLKISRRILTLVIVVLVFSGLSALIGWFIYSLVSEAVSLAKNIQALSDYMTNSLDLITERIRWILENIPGDTEEIFENIMGSFLVWIKNASSDFADYVISNTVTITTKISAGVVGAVIFIMSTYFITADYPKIKNLTDTFKNTRVHNYFLLVKNSAVSAFGGYIRAQLIIAFLAFTVMFIALMIYGQEYAFLIALLLSVIDFLPILGTAIILVPWGIICILGGDIGKGIFLFTLSLSFFLFRRFAEPKIVGSQTGLPPLLALISIYVGMRVMGIWGMILGPITCMVIVSVIKAGIFRNTVKDVKAVISDIGSIFKQD